MLGIPYMSRPPGRSSRSYDAHPRSRVRASSQARGQARRGPSPPRSRDGAPTPGAGQAASMPALPLRSRRAARSLSWIVTGSSCSPRLQATSHGAGQTRPGELRERIGQRRACQPHPRSHALVEQVVRLGNEVVQRAARLAARAGEHACRSGRRRRRSSCSGSPARAARVGGKRNRRTRRNLGGALRRTDAAECSTRSALEICSWLSHGYAPAPHRPRRRAPTASSCVATCLLRLRSMQREHRRLYSFGYDLHEVAARSSSKR